MLRAKLAVELPANRGQSALRLVEQRGDLSHPRTEVGIVGLWCGATMAGRRGIGWQRRRHDVAGREIAVHRHVLRAVIPEQRDVGAYHRVDRILVAVELYWPGRGLDALAEFNPGHVVVHPQAGRR